MPSKLTYSLKTVCPACERQVPLENVRLTPCFSCPLCERRIRVRAPYRTIQNVISYAGALLLPYLAGVRGVLWIALAVPLVVVLAGVQAYFVKYILPPTLEWCPDDVVRLGIN
jgi:hypothetical protein